MCDYNTVVKGMMRRHKLLTHHMSVKPTAVDSKQQISVDPLQPLLPVECLLCYKFSCKEEWELEIHKDEAHKDPVLQQLAGPGQQGVRRALEQVKVPEQQVQLQQAGPGGQVQKEEASTGDQQQSAAGQLVQQPLLAPGQQVPQQNTASGQQVQQQQAGQQASAPRHQEQVVFTGHQTGQQP